MTAIAPERSAYHIHRLALERRPCAQKHFGSQTGQYSVISNPRKAEKVDHSDSSQGGADTRGVHVCE